MLNFLVLFNTLKILYILHHYSNFELIDETSRIIQRIQGMLQKLYKISMYRRQNHYQEVLIMKS